MKNLNQRQPQDCLPFQVEVQLYEVPGGQEAEAGMTVESSASADSASNKCFIW
jgi:hypothetical protein